jgi:hypothetical protein
MDRATLIAALKSCDAALRENGATGLYIIGSRAHGDHRPDSRFGPVHEILWDIVTTHTHALETVMQALRGGLASLSQTVNGAG